MAPRSAVVLAALAASLAWTAPADDPDSRARALLAKMNLTEKIVLVHGTSGPYVGNVAGNSRLGIPSICMNDGPQGFRAQDAGTTTAWPSGLTVAAAFDRGLANTWGAAMGEEFVGKGANVQLGPGLCLARVPVNGRNFEYLSGEDPYLGYHLVQPVVQGIQGQGIANRLRQQQRETNRGSIENVDERTSGKCTSPPSRAPSTASSPSCAATTHQPDVRVENPDAHRRPQAA